MDAKANTRQSVDSNSPLLAKADGSTAASSSKFKDAGAMDLEAQKKKDARKRLNPEHPVSSIPFSMKQW
ncbi:hypothetical protein ISF_07179 [Cordyceps fumosorosea ARSEF 2679]|uniref:Uncharacterized protein n=1 Tax=Cordyceps fumosorosea (strain ARSEF 2679) TaxID=1081104 RepID=A0A167Q3W9_CORFA|nr:hypothetical protein ISF_07179 [Cordyceps fumosorosea ARSEF 2679]OAA57258.1 hypothetical protein ISF_07179 [Cordyceps fumosorosea ARSEF 2679]